MKDYCQSFHAVAASDYQVNQQKEIMISAGNTFGCIAIATIEDNIYEDDELFTVTLTSQDTHLVFGVGVAVINIIDDDSKLKRHY